MEGGDSDYDNRYGNEDHHHHCNNGSNVGFSLLSHGSIPLGEGEEEPFIETTVTEGEGGVREF